MVRVKGLLGLLFVFKHVSPHPPWHASDFLNTVMYMAAFESTDTPNGLTGPITVLY